MAFQSKSPGLSRAGRLVRAVIEDYRAAHAVAAVAVHRGHVGARDAIVLEVLVEGLHAHGPHPLGDQIADGIIDHRGDDAGLEAEAVRQVGGAVEFAAAHVDLAFGGLAKGDDTGVQPMDQGAQGDEVQCAAWGNIQTMIHKLALSSQLSFSAASALRSRLCFSALFSATPRLCGEKASLRRSVCPRSPARDAGDIQTSQRCNLRSLRCLCDLRFSQVLFLRVFLRPSAPLR